MKTGLCARMREKIAERRGLNTIETAILSMIILVAISGMLDVNGIIRKFNAMSTTANYIARTISKQGGVRTAVPSSFFGNRDRVYRTSAQIYKVVEENLNSAGIEDDEFEVTINGILFNPATNVPLVDYGGDLDVRISIDYDWAFASQFTGGQKTFEKSVQRNVVSAYKFRNTN